MYSVINDRSSKELRRVINIFFNNDNNSWLLLKHTYLHITGNEIVTKFKYLRYWLTDDWNPDCEIKIRIQTVRSIF